MTNALFGATAKERKRARDKGGTRLARIGEEEDIRPPFLNSAEGGYY